MAETNKFCFSICKKNFKQKKTNEFLVWFHHFPSRPKFNDAIVVECIFDPQRSNER